MLRPVYSARLQENGGCAILVCFTSRDSNSGDFDNVAQFFIWGQNRGNTCIVTSTLKIPCKVGFSEFYLVQQWKPALWDWYHARLKVQLTGNCQVHKTSIWCHYQASKCVVGCPGYDVSNSSPIRISRISNLSKIQANSDFNTCFFYQGLPVISETSSSCVIFTSTVPRHVLVAC